MAKDSLLRQTLEAYGYQCFWCGIKLVRTNEYRKLSTHDMSKYGLATIDHILPKSKGGTDHIKNLRPTCSGCNGARGNGWKNQAADIFPSCPLLQKLEAERPSLNIKLTFPTSTRWSDLWKNRLEYRLTPHKSQVVSSLEWLKANKEKEEEGK